jgi:uncharacterized protein (DUF2237 family)
VSLKENKMPQNNVLGTPLMPCCVNPMTGFYRDGYCHVGPDDRGVHAVCIEATSDFLEFSKSAGNDLSTPNPNYQFPGLNPGDKWCLCAARWKEAFEADAAPFVFLNSTSEKALEYVTLIDLKRHALDVDVNELLDDLKRKA